MARYMNQMFTGYKIETVWTRFTIQWGKERILPVRRQDGPGLHTCATSIDDAEMLINREMLLGGMGSNSSLQGS